MTESRLDLMHPKYRPDIDGLRAMAVLAVVTFHAFPEWLNGGFTGVDIFFVISGYLISTIILADLDRGAFRFAAFYARRIRRIFPALILVLMTSLAFGWFYLLAAEFRQLGKHVLAGASFTSNLVLWKEAGYFDNSSATKPLLHLWSLGIEEQFYIVWPLLLWIAWKRKINALAIVVVMAVASFALNLTQAEQHAVADFYSPQTRLWELSSGSVLASFMLHGRSQWDAIRHWIAARFPSGSDHDASHPRGDIVANLVSLTGLALLLYGFCTITTEVTFPGTWALVPVAGTALLILAGPQAFINRTILSNKLAVWFGLISFPLYLWHWPLLSFARIVGGEEPAIDVRIALVLLSVLLAWATFRLLERPIRFGGDAKAKVLALVGLMLVTGYTGYSIHSHDGFRRRSINQLNEGVGQAISYNWNTGYRYGECLIDDTSDETGTFAGVCGENKNGLPSLLIWGDSHSAGLYRGFEAYADSRHYTVQQFSASGCPPILEFNVSKRRQCINSNRFVYKEIERLKPDVVVLSAYWSLYDGTDGWEALDEAKLTATITKLKLLGIRKIVLIGHLPTFTINQPNLLRRHSGSDKVSVRTYHKFKPAAKLYDEKIRSIAALTGSDFVSPLDLLCDATGCLVSVPGADIVPLSFDTAHLTANGSRFLVSKLFELGAIKLGN